MEGDLFIATRIDRQGQDQRRRRLCCHDELLATIDRLAELDHTGLRHAHSQRRRVCRPSQPRLCLLVFRPRSSPRWLLPCRAWRWRWQIYYLTGKPFDLGLVGLAEFLPAFVLALVSGQIAIVSTAAWWVFSLGLLAEAAAASSLIVHGRPRPRSA